MELKEKEVLLALLVVENFLMDHLVHLDCPADQVNQAYQGMMVIKARQVRLDRKEYLEDKECQVCLVLKALQELKERREILEFQEPRALLDRLDCLDY